MCGIAGISGYEEVNAPLYEALTVLQHRGQDAAGIATCHDHRFYLRKAKGLVRDVFQKRHMKRLRGNTGIGHARYPTAGSLAAAESQPFYVNSPYGIMLAHNGNLTNTAALRKELFHTERRHINTRSDSEVLLNIFAHELYTVSQSVLTPADVFNGIRGVHRRCRGGYAAVALISGYGLVAFRDPMGIRPLVLGCRITEQGMEYMVASESVALDCLGFEMIRDVSPGEAVYIDENKQLHTEVCVDNPELRPCLFEYVYMARPDSVMNGISVYSARLHMGKTLAEKVSKEWDLNTIDVVMPIPDSSRAAALELAQQLNLPYREGFVKNRYIGRTFIMPAQEERRHSVHRKLNAIQAEFCGKNVLLVDDSIVRGTTSRQIVEMAREAGAAKVYFCSAAPPVRHPNVYGIDMPVANELVAYGRTVDEVCEYIGADALIYQDLAAIGAVMKEENPEIECFDNAVFDGHYITGDIDKKYLDDLAAARKTGLADHSSEDAECDELV